MPPLLHPDTVAIERPQRWDHPLDPSLESREVDWILSQPPFSLMDPKRFPKTSRLEDIIRNDMRILRYQAGDIVLRRGDYGSSAFLVLTGEVRVVLDKIALGPQPQTLPEKPSLLKALSDSLKHWKVPEFRRIAQLADEPAPATAIRHVDNRPRLFLQDFDVILDGVQSEPIGSGGLFGELAAMTRSPNNFTVVAMKPCVLLEIRWQGLRLLRRDPIFKEQLDTRYRAVSLQSHLRECPLFEYLPQSDLDRIAGATELRSFGEREWFAEYHKTKSLDVREQLKQEPLIVAEGTPADHLVVIRAGFARLSHQQGDGHRTLAYLGKGQIFGQRELAHNHRRRGVEEPLPYQESLRAVGFVDALFIPKFIVYESIFPYVRQSAIWDDIAQPRYDSLGRALPAARSLDERDNDKTALLEFLVDERLINGRHAMVIDTDRCTRCDDCVRACAATHQGNPRFRRNGSQFGSWLFTHACMHCEDPVCMIGCPTGAIARNPDNGVIDINPNTCIGCATCSESCPYDNISMVNVRDENNLRLVDSNTRLPILQATKCDLCQNQWSGPACQNACPHDALVRIDIGNLKRVGDWMDRKAS